MADLVQSYWILSINVLSLFDLIHCQIFNFYKNEFFQLLNFKFNSLSDF